MRKILLTSITLAGIVICNAQAQVNYPSLPSKVLSTYVLPKIKDRSPTAQAKAAKNFLASLDANQKKQAQLAFNDKEKQKWTNLPPRGPQGGIRLGDLNEKQLQQAMIALATIMSEQGYLKARNIPLADDRLLRNGKRRPGFGAEDYWLVILGEPSADKPWAIQFDGHHIAVNVAIHGKKMSLSPSFIGTQPREFKLGNKAITPIQGKADKAHDLINLLSPEQRKIAIISTTRGRIVTAAGKDGFIPKYQGIPVKNLSEKVQTKLLSLIREYVDDLPKHAADARMAELKNELNKMYLAWSGPTAHKSDVSYRIQGPSLIIEYACQNLGGNPINHIHSMYRDPTNEYGKRIVK